MNTNSPDNAGNYPPNTLDEFPKLTPEEVGRRFLKLIGSLKSFDELSIERVHEIMQLPMRDIGLIGSKDFNGYLEESGWYYGFSYMDYYNEVFQIHAKSADYQLVNGKHEYADMAPVCKMDLSAYVVALKKMGFQKSEAIYYALNQLGNIFYSRGNVMVTIRERRKGRAPDKELSNSCMEYIGISRIGG